MEEGRDGLARLRDVVVDVVYLQKILITRVTRLQFRLDPSRLLPSKVEETLSTSKAC